MVEHLLSLVYPFPRFNPQCWHVGYGQQIKQGRGGVSRFLMHTGSTLPIQTTHFQWRRRILTVHQCKVVMPEQLNVYTHLLEHILGSKNKENITGILRMLILHLESAWLKSRRHSIASIRRFLACSTSAMFSNKETEWPNIGRHTTVYSRCTMLKHMNTEQ